MTRINLLKKYGVTNAPKEKKELDVKVILLDMTVPEVYPAGTRI
jgi:hypothetical protein